MKLLIIDVQNSYMEFIGDDLLNRIDQLSKNYSDIIYLWDNVSGQELYDELPESWINNDEFDEEGLVVEKEESPLYDRVSKVIDKQYGYIRNIMDTNHSREDIVLLGKFLIKNKITDATEISENEEALNSYKNEFKNSSLLDVNFEDNVFSLPTDLLEELSYLDGAHLVGGARHECLEEISILLDIIDIPYTILEEYCY